MAYYSGYIVSSGISDVLNSGDRSESASIYGEQHISSGGMADNVNIYNGGEQYIYSRGYAHSYINSGGQQIVYSKGQGDSEIYFGGMQNIYSYGSGYANISNGGQQNI